MTRARPTTTGKVISQEGTRYGLMALIRTVLVVSLLVASGALPTGTAAATTQQSEAYAGTHIEFETTSEAIANYCAVNCLLKRDRAD